MTILFTESCSMSHFSTLYQISGQQHLFQGVRDVTIFRNNAKRRPDLDRFRHYEILIFLEKKLYDTKYCLFLSNYKNRVIKNELYKVLCQFKNTSSLTNFSQFLTF